MPRHLVKKLRFVFVIISIGVVIGCFGIIWLENSSSQPAPTPSRQIVQNSSSIHELWRKGDIWLLRGGRNTAPRLPATNEIIGYANYDSSSLQSQLQVLDAESGRLIWETPDQLSLHSLIAEDNHLFVAVNWEIRGYQLTNGQLLWQTPGEPSQRTGYDLTWLDEKVVVYANILGENATLMSVYDTTTGDLVQRSRIPARPRPLLITSQTEYQGECGKLLAVDRHTTEVGWQIELTGGCPEPWPLLIGSNLLVHTSADYRGSVTNRISGLYLIDTTSGIINWRALEGEIISNPAVIDRTIYAIRRNGDIVGIDLDTGQEVGTIQFNISQTDPRQNAYWLAANGRQLFAYYGDSRELIAFQH